MSRVVSEVKNFIVASRVKERAKEAGLRVAADTLVALNESVGRELDRATLRAKANGRKTIKPHDVEPPVK